MSWYEAAFSRMGAQLTGSAIRQMGILAAGRPDLISFAPGYPDPEAFAWDAYRDIADDLLRARQPETLQYGPTRGYGPLLEALVPHLRAPRHHLHARRTDPDDGLAAGRRPGDAPASSTRAMWCSSNCRRSRARSRRFAARAPGWSACDRRPMASTSRISTRCWPRSGRPGARVKFLYVIPNFQNPTGGLLSLAKRRALLAWSVREQVLIVEDDPYGDLWFADVTRPRRRGRSRPTTPTATSSICRARRRRWRRRFAPPGSWRPPPVIARLDVAKQSADLCSSSLDQRLVLEAIDARRARRALPRLRAVYAHKRDVMSRR